MSERGPRQLADVEPCGCCGFEVGSHYAFLPCAEHGRGASVLDMSDPVSPPTPDTSMEDTNE